MIAKTVMVVDDAKFMRMRVSKLLSQNGYKVVEAEDGNAAVQTYQAKSPDAVIMDITMPRKDGISALREILDFDSRARVIMLTALGQQSVVLEAMKAGAKDFLVKPYDPDRVLKTLGKVLG
jgi:two-component system chemotaxis response regulator CheY